MKHLFVSLLIPAFMLAGVVTSPAMAQDKAKAEKGKSVQKVLHEDDKVRVTETTSKPGDVSANIVRGFRVTRWLQGGTQERTYADGKKEKFERKAGEVAVQGPDKQAFFITNIGKTTIVAYTVNIKTAKK
jgi:hypothetical protein